MDDQPAETSVRWAVLPPCLEFLYGKLPVRAPQVSSVVLARDQCWCSQNVRFPMSDGWVWEILGFSGSSMCIRLWGVDGGVMRRRLRVGGQVRLTSPSHGAATTVWVPQDELLGGVGWEVDRKMYRVMLGPDLNGYGVCREVLAIFSQSFR